MVSGKARPWWAGDVLKYFITVTACVITTVIITMIITTIITIITIIIITMISIIILRTVPCLILEIQQPECLLKSVSVAMPWTSPLHARATAAGGGFASKSNGTFKWEFMRVCTKPPFSSQKAMFALQQKRHLCRSRCAILYICSSSFPIL